MKYLLSELFSTEHFGEKRLFNTNQEALSYISKCMANEKVVAWVRENAGNVSHCHIWEITECIMPGEHDPTGQSWDGKVTEIEGEKIASFGYTETFITCVFGYQDRIEVTLLDFYSNEVIAKQVIRN